MIQPRYLLWLALGTALWSALYLGFTWGVDPYGVSPGIRGAGEAEEFRPRRKNIDRLLKPYEVLRYQPRTLFLGSSRILESIDPAVLDGSRYAPAYNAAVPANMLSYDAARLRQYIRLDPALKHVVVELFFWNLIYPQPEAPEHGLAELFRDSVALHASAQTLWDSILTLQARASIARKDKTDFVGRRGNWIRLEDRSPHLSFERYIDEIMRIQRNFPKVELQPGVFQALDRMVAICRENGVELYFLMTPNHPYDDYRILSFGYWDVLEQLYRRLARYPNVLAASQYTVLLTEPVSPSMLYWNDPIHPSERFGTAILEAFRGEPRRNAPADVLLPLDEGTAEDLIRTRREGLERWMAANRDFTGAFDRARRN